MNYYLLKYHPPRSGFAESQTDAESAIIAEHFEYLCRLHEEGIVAFAGRVEDARFGLALLRCESQADAEKLAAVDPAVTGQVFRAEVLPFSLALPPERAD